MNDHLTKLEAFNSMQKFLEDFYKRIKSNDIAAYAVIYRYLKMEQQQILLHGIIGLMPSIMLKKKATRTIFI